MRLIDADAMKEELLWGNVYLSDNETDELVDLISIQPTIYPENLRPMGWWRYNKETCSWKCGQCGWRNPLMPPDGPSPDGEQFSYCMSCGAKMVGECYDNK